MPSSLNLALIINASDDHNSAFEHTRREFETRKQVLVSDGFEILEPANSSSFASFFCRDEFREFFRRSVFMQIWRGHGSSTSFFLSNQVEGEASTQADASMQLYLKKTCEVIQENGILVTESCSNGFGKNSFSKYLTGFCNKGVVVIGSKIGDHHIEVRSGLPRYQRFFDSNGQDMTRIYYKTSSRTVQNISPYQFDILWTFLGNSQDTFDLCYLLLGERNNPSSYQKIKKDNETWLTPYIESKNLIEEMRGLKITRKNIESIWEEMFSSIEQLPQFSTLFSRLKTEPIPEKMRQSLRFDDRGDLKWDRNLSPEEIAYFFLLGVASLEQYKSIFQLYDDSDETSDQLISCAIFALSGLPLHTKDEFSVFQKLKYLIQIVKKSYEHAKK